MQLSIEMVSATISEQILKVQCVVENIITYKHFTAKRKGFLVEKKCLVFFSEMSANVIIENYNRKKNI